MLYFCGYRICSFFSFFFVLTKILLLCRRIPSLLWNTEILIIVNNDISNDSNILDNSIYGIASVNIISMSGIWKLSDNYLNPRVFAKLDK